MTNSNSRETESVTQVWWLVCGWCWCSLWFRVFGVRSVETWTVPMTCGAPISMETGGWSSKVLHEIPTWSVCLFTRADSPLSLEEHSMLWPDWKLCQFSCFWSHDCLGTLATMGWSRCTAQSLIDWLGWKNCKRIVADLSLMLSRRLSGNDLTKIAPGSFDKLTGLQSLYGIESYWSQSV